jgi:hypothetical protein
VSTPTSDLLKKPEKVMGLYKTITTAIAAAMIVGCVSTAPSSSYRPMGSNYASWLVSGSFNKLTNQVIITINGTEVIKDKTSIWDGSGKFVGNYRSHQVAAICQFVENFLEEYEQCLVLIDGERTAVLRF